MMIRVLAYVVGFCSVLALAGCDESKSSDLDTGTSTDSSTFDNIGWSTDSATFETDSQTSDPALRNETCYSPCSRGMMLNDEYLPCSEEGLIAACLGNTTCVDGWCVAPQAKGQEFPVPFTSSVDGTCDDDCDCPLHGACMDGLCGGNCEGNSDCSAGEGCRSKVCRNICTADDQSSCLSGTVCEVGDNGVDGFCVPQCDTADPVDSPASCIMSVQGNKPPVEVVTGDLSNPVILLGEDHTDGEFIVRNNTQCDLSFTIMPKKHTIYGFDGATKETENPLTFVTLTTGSDSATGPDVLAVNVAAGEEAVVTVSAVHDAARPNWEGLLVIKSDDGLSKTRVRLSYVSGAEGQWVGKMYSFAQFGDANLDAWMGDKDNSTLLNNLDNALIKRWDVLRRGEISVNNFRAMLASTQNGSWSWSSTMNECSKILGACYPFANPDEGSLDDGLEPYSDDLEADKIPSAMVELPIAMHLQNSTGGTNELLGRIVSDQTLHYAGNPAVSFAFNQDPASCTSSGGQGICLNRLVDFSATTVVGGRFVPAAGTTDCGTDFERRSDPWLLADFSKGTELDGGRRMRPECRDKTVPFDQSSGIGSVSETEAVNANFAGSNPLADGRNLTRTITLLDGAMIDKSTLFVLFRESFTVPLVEGEASTDFGTYGYMLLERTPAQVESDEYAGSIQTPRVDQGNVELAATCDPELISSLNLEFDSAANRTRAVDYLVDGLPTRISTDPDITQLNSVQIHFLCWETGLFDQGPSGSSICPLSSAVTFFDFLGTNSALENEDCQLGSNSDLPEGAGTCGAQLHEWQLQGEVIEPHWECSDASQDVCESELDRKDGKVFYNYNTVTTEIATPLLKIDTAVNEAFRYKTAFRSRSGTNVGFAPDICVDGSTAVPYCYAPQKIEEIAQRVTCAQYLYDEFYSDGTGATAQKLRGFLSRNYSRRCIDDSLGAEACGRPENQLDGFEPLNAELLVMLGDESYTRAFASRFDLAGAGMASFEGSAFEPGGINLSGVAGYEMYSLYQGAQYYQLALDRFYGMLSSLTATLADKEDGFVSGETATVYYNRLIRASTQKSRAFSEIAKRYQSFNRPDLARRVIQRAYTSTFLESILLTRAMRDAIVAVPPEDEAQIWHDVSMAQLQYKAALLAMRDVNQDITDEVNYFGFAPDYIPFPAMDRFDINAFEKLLDSAWKKTTFAASKESQALLGNKGYETDMASFQAELASIRNTYENQLTELCGNFQGEDGGAYPAIIEYAHLDPKARGLGDPCGLMGNGGIYESLMDLSLADLEVTRLTRNRENILAEIEIERERVSSVCDEIIELKDYTMAMHGTRMTLQALIEAADITVNTIQRAQDTIYHTAELTKCSVGTSTDCPTAGAAIGMVTGSSIATNAALTVVEVGQALAREGIMAADMAQAEFELETQCDLAQVDSVAKVSTLALGLLTSDIEIMEGYLNLQLAQSNIGKLLNEAIRTRAEYTEITEHAINVEAARNDPNSRIYKNDAVINADKAFESAIREAYKATKVFEYYTSQSYAHLVDLFLVRMIAAGDYNLENYLMELEEAFYGFEEQYGNPDVRLAILSLKDDIFKVDAFDEDNPGVALSVADRNVLFYEQLTESINSNGAYQVQFPTRLDALSPLTRNHKILYVEAEFVGRDLGDQVGRVYLTQNGTGTVHAVDGHLLYYRFPERTSVVDAFFNGVRNIADDSVYQSKNLRDRPLASSQWNLIFDPHGEPVNRDIKVEGIEDIKIYVYYADFTQM